MLRGGMWLGEPFGPLFTGVRRSRVLRTSHRRSSKKFDRGRFLEVGLSYPRGCLLYLPVGRMLHRRLKLLEVLRDLLKSPGLILEGLHLVLVALVVRVAAAFEQQGVDRPGGLVRLPVAILIVGGDRDALSQALGPQILDHVLVGVPNGGQVRLRGHEVDAVLEVGQLGYVVAAGALKWRGELEGDVLGRAVAYVPDHYVGGEAPGVVGVHYDLGAVCVVAGLTGLPALVEDPARDDEGANGRQKLC